MSLRVLTWLETIGELLFLGLLLVLESLVECTWIILERTHIHTHEVSISIRRSVSLAHSRFVCFDIVRLVAE